MCSWHHTDQKLPQVQPQIQEMSMALSLAVEGISRLDPEGHYLFVNEAYARMVGYLPAEMIGSNWQMTVHPDDCEKAISAYRQMVSEGRVELEVRGLRKDGSVFDKALVMVSAYDEQQQFTGHYCFMKDVSDRKQKELQLQQQLERERLIAEITDAIRKTLDLDQILNSAVEQLRRLLQTDRVLIFRFQADWQGVVEAESIAPGWLKTLGMRIQDSCFNEAYVETYRQGRVSAIADLDVANISPCHIVLLKTVQVRANLVVPILQDNHLWGLLIAHHCSGPREWAPENNQLLQQVSAQMGIAIQQAELYQTTRRELLERRQIQEALQASEERFRALSAFAPVGIYQTDLAGHCTYTNRKWQEISGLTLEKSLGDKWGQAIHPSDQEKVFTTWNRFVREECDFSLEFRFLKQPEGEERWVFGRAIAIKSPTGHTIGYVGVNEDITERKLAEHKIREQAALIDITTDAIFVRHLDGKIMFWSQGAARLYGWSAEEAVGKVAHQLLAKKPAAELSKAMQATIAQGFWQGELTQLTKAGNEILVASRWTLVRDDEGEPQSLLEVNTDITKKKQLEAQFYQAQRLESLGQLAGGIAHDLGNVLTPILGISQLLRLSLKALDDSTQRKLEILEQSAKRGTQMVKQILIFAQGSSEDETLVDVIAILQEVLDVARQGFSNAIKIRLNINQEENLDGLQSQVLADSTHLHQIFMNLCINAYDAMPDGGILTVSVDHEFVDEPLTSQALDVSVGNYVVVSITDTGTGIAPELRDRIFDPFFTTKASDKGTGLGLATVLGIVKKAGGFLKVSSEIGKGTQMKVYLPLAEVN